MTNKLREPFFRGKLTKDQFWNLITPSGKEIWLRVKKGRILEVWEGPLT